MLFFPLIVIASFRFLDVGPDYPSYKYIYENSKMTEPIFYIVNIFFRKMGFPFQWFHLILSVIAFYWFLRFLVRSNFSFLTIFCSGIFFYVFHIASHWRTGLALGLVCLLADRRVHTKIHILIIPALVHISALTLTIANFVSRNFIFFVCIVAFVNFFILGFIGFLGPEIFKLLGREKFYYAIISVALGQDNYLHRSLWAWDNLRLYFVVLTSSLMWSDWKKNNSMIINLVMIGNFAFILFMFNAYLAQKTYLFIKPLQLAAAVSLSDKQKRNFCLSIILLFSFLDVFERYAERF